MIRTNVVELWASIPGLDENYEASDLGRIRSVIDNQRRRRVVPVILSQSLCGSRRYFKVNVQVDRKGKIKLVHLLVLEAFSGPALGRDGLHGPGGSFDNRFCNLAWGSKYENSMDRWRDGTMNEGSKNSQSKLTEEKVIDIKAKLAAGATSSELARIYGVSAQTVSTIKHGQAWRHVG
jgi:hypothetical protein